MMELLRSYACERREVNCGRTLIGKLPTKHQQGDLNYFAPVPGSVEKLMMNIQAPCTSSVPAS